jgi:hypothetical protein
MGTITNENKEGYSMASRQTTKYQQQILRLKIIASVALLLCVVFAAGLGYTLLNMQPQNTTKNTTPPQPFGERLTGINDPFNASALAVINNAPDSYFERAGEMLLNGSIKNTVSISTVTVGNFTVNGKPSVIYLGSITCIFCGENRWAMVLALSRFGQFTNLYQGYSSFGDADVPTVYFTPVNYSKQGLQIGNAYTSNYISFITFEDTGPITAGFFVQPLQTIQNETNATGNRTYIDAFKYLMSLQTENHTAFSGTPYTIWGSSLFSGADAVDFSNSTPTTSVIPLTYETHAQVLQQLANGTDGFALTDYAAADIYISKVCLALNNSASICQVPIIQRLEKL